MSITPTEAAHSLAEAESTLRRSQQAIGYSRSSPFLLTLGVFWIVCYGTAQFWPERISLIWGCGMAFFTPIMIWLAVRSQRMAANPRSQSINRNFSIIFGLILPAFTVASIAVMWPIGGLRIGVFIPLIYASLYTGMGLWLGQRYVIAGITVFAATLMGFYFLRDYFAVWMAVVGGGSFVLTGLWLRKA
jgi:hypothetical protein